MSAERILIQFVEIGQNDVVRHMDNAVTHIRICERNPRKRLLGVIGSPLVLEGAIASGTGFFSVGRSRELPTLEVGIRIRLGFRIDYVIQENKNGFVLRQRIKLYFLRIKAKDFVSFQGFERIVVRHKYRQWQVVRGYLKKGGQLVLVDKFTISGKKCSQNVTNDFHCQCQIRSIHTFIECVKDKDKRRIEKKSRCKISKVTNVFIKANVLHVLTG